MSLHLEEQLSAADVGVERNEGEGRQAEHAPDAVKSLERGLVLDEDGRRSDVGERGAGDVEQGADGEQRLEDLRLWIALVPARAGAIDARGARDREGAPAADAQDGAPRERRSVVER